MKRYVKNAKGYDRVSYDSKEVIEGNRRARERLGVRRKVPTSVALDPDLVKRMKAEAKKRGVAYQTLMRMFIIEGFQRLKSSA